MRRKLVVGAALCVALAFGVWTPAQVFPGPSLTADVTFTDALTSTSMTMAFDGTYYWSCSGGGPSGTRLARYTALGVGAGTYAPGLDFRSVYALGATVYARHFSDATIYQQSSPGVFAPSGVTLAGGTLDGQSGVVPSGAGTELIAMTGGTVQRWSLSGASLGTVTLVGFGSQNSESTYPQGRGVAATGAYYFTYANGVVSAWSAAGVRIDQATLVGAGTGFDSYFSFSFANGRFWVVDAAGGTWRGYPLQAQGSPEPVPALDELGLAVLALVLAAVGLWLARRRIL